MIEKLDELYMQQHPSAKFTYEKANDELNAVYGYLRT